VLDLPEAAAVGLSSSSSSPLLCDCLCPSIEKKLSRFVICDCGRRRLEVEEEMEVVGSSSYG
jgi:hypothetical protein